MRLRPEQTHHMWTQQRRRGRLRGGWESQFLIHHPPSSMGFSRVPPPPPPVYPMHVSHSQPPHQLPAVGAVSPQELSSGWAGGSGPPRRHLGPPAPPNRPNLPRRPDLLGDPGFPAWRVSSLLWVSSLLPCHQPLSQEGCHPKKQRDQPLQQHASSLPGAGRGCAAHGVPAMGHFLATQGRAITPLQTKSPAQSCFVPGLAEFSLPAGARLCPGRSRGMYGQKRVPVPSGSCSKAVLPQCAAGAGPAALPSETDPWAWGWSAGHRNRGFPLGWDAGPATRSCSPWCSPSHRTGHGTPASWASLFSPWGAKG